MTNHATSDGATVVPADIAAQLATDESCPVEVRDNKGNVSIQLLKHNWHWVWRDGLFTNDRQCGACNKLEENVR